MRLRLRIPDRIGWAGRNLPTPVAAFWLAVVAALAAEWLVELRRGAFFAGSFRHFFALKTADESIAFVFALVLAQICLAWLLYRAVRLVSRRSPGLFAYDFLAVAGLATLALLSVKSRLIGFFADRLSLDLARELGGDSLVQALLYVADEVLLLAATLLPFLLAVWLIRRQLRPETGEAVLPAPRRRVAARFAVALMLAAALVVAARFPSAQFQLERFAAPRLFYLVLGAATDVDGDGYSLVSGPPDAHPFDPARHPLALDVPGNGIDEDDFGGDLRPFSEASEPVFRFAGERRHIVLVVLESTRAEAVGKRWGGRLVAPNLTALAAAGTSAPRAYSNFAMTARSLKTLFTGRILPAPGAPSLFRDFDSAGYRVGILSSQAEDFAGIAEMSAMREAADIFVDAASLTGSGTPYAVSRRVVDGRLLLREWDRHLADPAGWARPTFLYVNLQPAHFPYAAPGTPDILPGRTLARSEISAANRDGVVRNYWNSVAYADWLLGELVRRLRAAGAWERTTLVVVGDHGEEVFDNGYIGHGSALNDLQTRVPLVFSTRTALPPLIGQDDLRALILRAAGADLTASASDEVFQLLGYFAKPALIGLVRREGGTITYSPVTGEVAAPGIPAGTAYRDLAPGHPVRSAVDRLVERWQRERWSQYIGARAACRTRWSAGVNGAFEVDRRRACGSH